MSLPSFRVGAAATVSLDRRRPEECALADQCSRCQREIGDTGGESGPASPSHVFRSAGGRGNRAANLRATGGGWRERQRDHRHASSTDEGGWGRSRGSASSTCGKCAVSGTAMLLRGLVEHRANLPACVSCGFRPLRRSEQELRNVARVYRGPPESLPVSSTRPYRAPVPDVAGWGGRGPLRLSGPLPDSWPLHHVSSRTPTPVTMGHVAGNLHQKSQKGASCLPAARGSAP